MTVANCVQKQATVIGNESNLYRSASWFISCFVMRSFSFTSHEVRFSLQQYNRFGCIQQQTTNRMTYRAQSIIQESASQSNKKLTAHLHRNTVPKYTMFLHKLPCSSSYTYYFSAIYSKSHEHRWHICNFICT